MVGRLLSALALILWMNAVVIEGLPEEKLTVPELTGWLPEEKVAVPELVGLPEEKLTVPELIKYWGYPVEVHEAVTSDGYLLALHRIPHGKKSKTPTKGVFFLQHAFLSSSSDWVMNLPEQCIAFILADAGYDVWLGNNRGNIYSKKHKTLKVDSNKFWDFTIDEMTKYDVPAMIDHVLKETKQSSLYYIGQSQGSMIAIAALSENVELQKKVKVFFAMSPLTRMNHIKGAIKGISSWGSKLSYFFRFFNIREFFPTSSWNKKFMSFLCKMVPLMCKFGISFLDGHSGHLNVTRIPIIVAHTPAGTSTKNVIHYFQMINSGLFRKYDYGKYGNRQKYGTDVPPEYDVSKVRVPTVVFDGTMDVLAPPADVDWTVAHLGLVMKRFSPKYTHMDFCWGKESGPYLYGIIKFYVQ